MKNTMLILLSLFLLSGCSSFYHAHYRKLNKVDASGFVSEKTDSLFAAKLKNGNYPGQTGKSVLGKVLNVKKSIRFRKQRPEANSKSGMPKPFPVVKNKTVFPAVKQLQQKASFNHRGNLIPLLLLVGSFFLLIWGLIAIFFGLAVFSPPLIIFGILLTIFGGFPILIQIRNAIVVRRNQQLYEPKH